MDEKLATALARRLAAYSATAGVALAVAPEAAAQGAPIDPERFVTGSGVVYHDLDPNVTFLTDNRGFGSFGFDFDDDGQTDLLVLACHNNYYTNCDSPEGFPYIVALRAPEDANAQNGVLGYPGGAYVGPFASRLSSGDEVGSADPGQGFYPYAVAAWGGVYGTQFGAFTGRIGYAGFRFVGGDGELHYGWLRLGASGDATRARVYEFAYEAAPETPILAGDAGTQAPAVLLDGTVNQTTFPPEGGTLTFTATVTNISDEPEALDLWAVVRDPRGRVHTVRRFGSGVVPAGASVPVSVSAAVPPAAPARTGEIRFHIGRYPVVVDTETFTVTKEGAHGAHAEEAFFTEGVPAADLFGAAAEAAAVLPGTHALSAPVPNPTTGRAEVTLTVAEAQHIRVEVLDALGRRVALLHDGVLGAGEAHRLVFDGSGLPAGVYVVRAVGETFADTRVVTLAR